MMSVRRVALLLSPILLCGCGNPGLPLPPSLMLPQPVTDLGASRTGDVVSLHWTMPRRTTDRVVLKGDQRVLVCRAVGSEPCKVVGGLLLEPGKPASFEDILPQSLSSGAAQVLGYKVMLENHARHDAGPSNLAWTAAGWAPPTVHQATATMSARGVNIQWDAAPAPAATPDKDAVLRVHLVRERVLAAGESQQPDKSEVQAGVPQPTEQVLEAPLHPPGRPGGEWTPSSTLDANAAQNRTYHYTVQLLEQVHAGGHLIEIAGVAGATGNVQAKDVYPPAVPTDLAAVANMAGASIDLSWSVGSDADLAGYVVYRRDTSGNAAAVRISGAALLPAASWTDAKAAKGVRYAYSVSAVDLSGNQSARSTEVEEELPQ